MISSLRSIPPLNSAYFFWSGQGDAQSAVKGYQRSFRKLFRIANIKHPDGSLKRCHPHMFRDTFAVELLLAGVPVDQVSMLLGHRSVKMTEKHYLPWVEARQKLLTQRVRRAWFPEAKAVRPLPIERAENSHGRTPQVSSSCRPQEFRPCANSRHSLPFSSYL